MRLLNELTSINTIGQVCRTTTAPQRSLRGPAGPAGTVPSRQRHQQRAAAVDPPSTAASRSGTHRIHLVSRPPTPHGRHDARVAMVTDTVVHINILSCRRHASRRFSGRAAAFRRRRHAATARAVGPPCRPSHFPPERRYPKQRVRHRRLGETRLHTHAQRRVEGGRGGDRGTLAPGGNILGAIFCMIYYKCITTYVCRCMNFLCMPT